MSVQLIRRQASQALIDDMEAAAVNAAVSRAIGDRTLAPPIECISGKVTINRRFGPPASVMKDLGQGKRYCLTKYAGVSA